MRWRVAREARSTWSIILGRKMGLCNVRARGRSLDRRRGGYGCGIRAHRWRYRRLALPLAEFAALLFLCSPEGRLGLPSSPEAR